MNDELQGVIFLPDVAVKVTEAEHRVIDAARQNQRIRRHIIDAIDHGDVLLSSEGLVALKEVQAQVRRRTRSEPLLRQVRRDLELLRAATVMQRVALHGARLLARSGRWDGTVKGAHEISPGLLEPDPLG